MIKVGILYADLIDHYCFVCGTKNFGKEGLEKVCDHLVYVGADDGDAMYDKLKLHKVDSKYYITNGPAFLNKNNFYHTDTRKKIIYKIRINNKLKILKKSVFLKFRKVDGFPDGMTTDTKNNLWVCHYAGGCISVYNLKGKKIHKINLPAKNITNCTFGGSKYNQLYVSTARKDLKIKDINKYPLSGSLFKMRTNIKGKSTQSFKLSS